MRQQSEPSLGERDKMDEDYDMFTKLSLDSKLNVIYTELQILKETLKNKI